MSFFGDLIDLDFLGDGGSVASEAAPDAAEFAGTGVGTSLDLANQVAPSALDAFLSGGANIAGMAGNILSDPNVLRFLLPAATIGGGALLGNLAGSAAEARFRPTTNERDLMGKMSGQPIDIPTLAAQMSQLMSPQIQQTLEQERRAAGGLNERAIGYGSPYSSARVEAQGRLRQGTDQGIAAAIANAVTGQRQQNLGSMADALARMQTQRGQGVQAGMQASQAAAGAPMNALILSQILGGKGGLFAA